MTDDERAALVDRDRLALIIQGAMSEHLSVDALEMEVDGTGPASYRAADRILDEIVPAIRADERARMAEVAYPLVGILWMAEEWREHIGWGSDYTGEYLDALEKADAAAAAIRELKDRP